MGECKLGRSDEQDVVMTSSGIGLIQIFVSKVICILKSVHHDVVGVLVTRKSKLSKTVRPEYQFVFQVSLV